jgi:PhzF family phenazine biosynthesis protein
VVLDGSGFSDEAMQAFAAWTNLSETTFVLPPTAAEADYRIRIFTPGTELAFAGHPTIGTCHAWLEAGNMPANPERPVQECGVGFVPLRSNGAGLAFAAPPLIRDGPVDSQDLERACLILQIDPDSVVEAQWADNGPGWIALQLASKAEVLAIEADLSAADRYNIGVFAVTGDSYPSPALEVRSFFREGGPGFEDPVTGSLNAALAQWLLSDGHIEAPYVASQGTAMGRKGRVHVDVADGAVWIGGNAVTCVEGKVRM